MLMREKCLEKAFPDPIHSRIGRPSSSFMANWLIMDFWRWYQIGMIPKKKTRSSVLLLKPGDGVEEGSFSHQCLWGGVDTTIGRLFADRQFVVRLWWLDGNSIIPAAIWCSAWIGRFFRLFIGLCHHQFSILHALLNPLLFCRTSLKSSLTQCAFHISCCDLEPYFLITIFRFESVFDHL